MRQRHRPRATPQHTMPCAAAPDAQLGASQIDGRSGKQYGPRVGVGGAAALMTWNIESRRHVYEGIRQF